MRMQLVLPMKDLDRALISSSRIRSAVRALAKEVGFKRLGDLWGGVDEATVSQKIDERGRHYMKPHEVLAAMAIDNSGGILGAFCSELGYEMPERKPDEASEIERYRAAAQSLLGDELFEVLERKVGR